MRLFLFQWPTVLGLERAAKKLKAEGHEIAYWVLSDIGEAKRLRADFPDTVFHDHFSAFAGAPAEELRRETFAPAGRKEIEACRAIESVALSMMSKRFETWYTEEKKHLYYHLLSYWQGVIEKYRPDALVFTAIPHSVYDYLAYELARRKGIKTIVFEGSIIGDRMLAYEDFRLGHPGLLPEAWRKRGEEHTALEDLRADVRGYFLKQSELAAAKEVPEFTKATYPAVRVLLGGRYSKAAIAGKKVRTLLGHPDPLSLLRLAASFFRTRLGPNMKKEYISVVRPADTAQPFVYVPLHYQPEQSTSAQGDVFVDQRLMVEILSAALPQGWLLYVKEHPYQWLARGVSFFSLRPEGYYRSLAALPNVRIIPVETNTYALIRSAKAVATVAGAAALEAVAQKKPALLFGHVWFQHGPGIFKTDDVPSAKAAFEAIGSGYRVPENELFAFLFAFDKASFRGYLDEEWRAASTLSQEDNLKNIERVLLEMLRK